HLGIDDDFLNAFKGWQVVHGLKKDVFHDRTQAPRARLADDGFAGDRRQRILGKCQRDILHLEQTLVLLDERVLRRRQNFNQRLFIEVFERRDNRQTADEFRDQAEFQQIFRLDILQRLADVAIFLRLDSRAEADGGVLAARADDLVEPGEGAAADEQDI